LPITKREDAKEGGFAQVREALQRFKGLCTGATFDTWGGQLIDADGKKLPPREYLELSFTGVEVLETTAELNMDISEEFSVRINCSDFKGSFWVEMFLASTDKLKLVVPDGLKNKVLTLLKETLEAEDPKYNATNWVIVGVEEAGSAKPKTEAPKVEAQATDPTNAILELAVGKTEEELKAAISETLNGHPMLPLAEAGLLTQALVNAGKLALVDGKYQKA